MNRSRSAGVDTTPPEAYASPAATISLMSSGGWPGAISYPWMKGRGISMPFGRLVRPRCNGFETSRRIAPPYDWPVTACTIRPTATLSEFEYLKREPGSNLRSLCLTKDSSLRGGIDTVGCAMTSFWNALFFVKSGRPLACCNSWPRVTSAHAFGRYGSRWPIVSRRDSRPRSTSARATAPLNAFDTLAIRRWSFTWILRPVSTSATPTVSTRRSLPRWTTTTMPGGPVGRSTSASIACCSRGFCDRSSARASELAIAWLLGIDAASIAAAEMPATAAARALNPRGMDATSPFGHCHPVVTRLVLHPPNLSPGLAREEGPATYGRIGPLTVGPDDTWAHRVAAYRSGRRDELAGVVGGGEEVGIAGAVEGLDDGVGELQHVFVAMLGGALQRVRRCGPAPDDVGPRRLLGRGVGGDQGGGRGPGRREARQPLLGRQHRQHMPDGVGRSRGVDEQHWRAVAVAEVRSDRGVDQRPEAGRPPVRARRRSNRPDTRRPALAALEPIQPVGDEAALIVEPRDTLQRLGCRELAARGHDAGQLAIARGPERESVRELVAGFGGRRDIGVGDQTSHGVADPDHAVSGARHDARQQSRPPLDEYVGPWSVPQLVLEERRPARQPLGIAQRSLPLVRSDGCVR